MFNPPALPPVGWYDDPHRPGTRRWWNGRAWEAVWDDGGPADPEPALGEWLNSAFRLAFGRWRASLLIGLVSATATSVLIGLAVRHVLADVVIVDNEVTGWSSDRLPLGIGLVAIGTFLGAVGQLGLAVLMLRTADGESPGATTSDEFRSAGSAMLRAVRILPRTIGWSLLLVLGVAVVIGAVVGLTIVAPPLGVIAIIVLIPAVVFVGVRLAFWTQSLVDRPGQPFTRSWDVSRGRWWMTFGWLLLLGIIVWLMSVVLQTLSGVASGNVGAGFGQSSIEIDSDGNVARFEMVEAFPSSPLAITVGAVIAVITTVVAAGVADAAFALLYRTRNPRA